MKRHLIYAIFAIILPNAFALTHFNVVPNSGSNMTVILPVSTLFEINGVSVAVGDEIGVFNANGFCVGAMVWQNKNDAFPVYGANSLPDGTLFEGLAANEVLKFRFFDVSAAVEMNLESEMQNNENTYSTNGFRTIVKLYTLEGISSSISSSSLVSLSSNALSSSIISSSSLFLLSSEASLSSNVLSSSMVSSSSSEITTRIWGITNFQTTLESFSFSSTEEGTVDVFDYSGKKMRSFLISKGNNVSNWLLPKGIYFVKVRTSVVKVFQLYL